MNVKHKISHLSKLNIETFENKEFPDFNYLCLHKQTLLWILNILWNHWVGAGMEPVRTLLSPVCVCRMMNCSTLLVSKLVTSADFPQWQGCSWPGNIIIEKIIRENMEKIQAFSCDLLYSIVAKCWVMTKGNNVSSGSYSRVFNLINTLHLRSTWINSILDSQYSVT